MLTAALEVKDLKKSYGRIHAVQGVSFKVRKGICFGLLGPNGAGKSTTIEMVENILTPDSGEVLFEGQPISRDYLSELGVQFQHTSLPAKLTVRETLETFCALYPRSLPVDDLIQLCQLDGFKNQGHEKISGGQRQRLLLAVALCNDPKLILLDEPTTGLDPQARRHLWQIVKDIKMQGKTIILTTHYMDEAFELCDEIAIVDHGRIIASGTPRDLLTEHFKSVVLQFRKEDVSLEARRLLDGMGRVVELDRTLELHAEDLNGCLKALVGSGVDLNGLMIRQSNLEDLFLKLTGKALRS